MTVTVTGSICLFSSEPTHDLKCQSPQLIYNKNVHQVSFRRTGIHVFVDSLSSSSFKTTATKMTEKAANIEQVFPARVLRALSTLLHFILATASKGDRSLTLQFRNPKRSGN